MKLILLIPLSLLFAYGCSPRAVTPTSTTVAADSSYQLSDLQLVESSQDGSMPSVHAMITLLNPDSAAPVYGGTVRINGVSIPLLDHGSGTSYHGTGEAGPTPLHLDGSWQVFAVAGAAGYPSFTDSIRADRPHHDLRAGHWRIALESRRLHGPLECHGDRRRTRDGDGYIGSGRDQHRHHADGRSRIARDYTGHAHSPGTGAVAGHGDAWQYGARHCRRACSLQAWHRIAVCGERHAPALTFLMPLRARTGREPPLRPEERASILSDPLVFFIDRNPYRIWCP